jgi:DNA-binding CsgD family transcriptional regulator
VTVDPARGDIARWASGEIIRSSVETRYVARAAKFTSDEAQTAVLMKAATRADMRSLLLAVHGLTPREREITELLIAGTDPQDVAAQLNLSVHTIRSHVKAIFAKVGVSSRAELTAALASR